ncbi:Pyruvate/Phosphoenolpyruvate kinase-like domain-containing protein [Aspergillus venezuelensis]
MSWNLIGLEHGNTSDEGMHETVAATASCGVSPIIRLADAQGWMIKRALDCDAHGILVPMIESVDETKGIVEYSKFLPRGKRGFEALLAKTKFVQRGLEGVRVLTGEEYLGQANDGLVIAVQIGTKGAGTGFCATGVPDDQRCDWQGGYEEDHEKGAC